MRQAMVGLALVFAVLVAAAPAVAHHSFAAEFDANKPITIRGFVTKIDWNNPHVWIYMDVKDDKGVVANWGFEMGPPHLVQGQGWTRTTLKFGDEIIVSGSLAKNGSKRVNARDVTWASTGKKLGAGSSQGVTP